MKLTVVTLIAVLSVAAGCAPKEPVQVNIPVKQFEIPSIPPSFLDCKRPALPNPKTLTNNQISTLLLKYEKELNNCIDNQNKIKIYIHELREELKRTQGTT